MTSFRYNLAIEGVINRNADLFLPGSIQLPTTEVEVVDAPGSDRVIGKATAWSKDEDGVVSAVITLFEAYEDLASPALAHLSLGDLSFVKHGNTEGLGQFTKVSASRILSVFADTSPSAFGFPYVTLGDAKDQAEHSDGE